MTPRRLIEPARLAGSRMLHGTQSDERLVDLARAGHAAAFEAIVERYRQPLLRYCLRFLPAARAEDAVQQAFANAYRSLTTSDAQVDLRPWLYRITHNAALNQLRDRGFHTEELSEEIDGVERPDEAVERRERFSSVVAAVRDLPERQRDAILLREFEGRSYDEIAAVLGVGGGAVRQLLHRARAGVRSAATALTPYGLAERLLGGSGSRVAEASGGAALGAVLTKASAAVLVTGAVVGAVQVPRQHHHSTPRSDAAAAQEASVASAPAAPVAVRQATVPSGNGQTHRKAASDRGSRDPREHGDSGGHTRGEDRPSGSDDHRGSGGGGDRTLSGEPTDDSRGSGGGGGSDDSTPQLEHTGGGSGTSGGSGSTDSADPLNSEPVTSVDDTSGHDGSGTSGSGSTSPDSTSGGHGSDDVSSR